MILISAISVLARKTLSAWDLESNMGQILASSIVTWIIFNILICFYNERWLAWTSGYYCAQKMNNVFYKWALYYCYYCHHSSILISRRASSLVLIWLDMIASWWFLFIYSIILMDHWPASLPVTEKERGIKYMLPLGPIPRAGLLSNYLLAWNTAGA